MTGDRVPRTVGCLVLLLVVLVQLTPGFSAASVQGLDRRFGRNGIAMVDLPGLDRPWASAVGPDGSIVVAVSVGGSAEPAHRDTGDTVAAVRFTSRGVLDRTFTGKGWASLRLGGVVRPVRVFVAPDGRVTLAAFVASPVNTTAATLGLADERFSLIRWRRDGTLDSTFGERGIVTSPHAHGAAADAWLMADGGVLVLTLTDSGSALVRYTTQGELDPLFGVGGIAPAGRGHPVALAVQSDGKIVVGATECTPACVTSPITPLAWGVSRFLPTGESDPSFGSGGRVLIDFERSDALLEGIAVLSGNRVLAFGGAYDDAGGRAAMVRLLPDGSLDSAFDGDGRWLRRFGSAAESRIQRVGRASSSAIYAFVVTGGNTAPGNLLARITSSGAIDRAFGYRRSAVRGVSMVIQRGRPVVAGAPIGRPGVAVAAYSA